jgi:hypothetical protein
MPADPVGDPGLSTDPDPKRRLVSSAVPGPPVISAEAAARALCELFLPGSPGALLHRGPLRTVRATRRGIRLKQAA